jgi:hypothetical protein
MGELATHLLSAPGASPVVRICSSEAGEIQAHWQFGKACISAFRNCQLGLKYLHCRNAENPSFQHFCKYIFLELNYHNPLNTQNNKSGNTGIYGLPLFL